MLHTFVSYLRWILPFVYITGAWRFGDWRNWRKYYPTVLFIISVDFLVSILMYPYPLWTYEPSLWIPNHTICDFLFTFTFFAPIAFIYLSRYPYRSKWYKQALYTAVWVVIECTVEGIVFLARLITYHNGWNFGWSCVVWLFLFTGLYLHHRNPLWAWLLCFSLTLFLILYFHMPITHYK